MIVDADSAIEQYKGDPLIPKFKYIKALSVGPISGKEVMKVELDSLIAQHPSTEESKQELWILVAVLGDYGYLATFLQSQPQHGIGQTVYSFVKLLPG